MSQSLAVLAAASGPGLALVFLVSRHWPATRGGTGVHRTGDPLPARALYAGFHDGALTLVTPIGVFATGFRWCPECLRQEAAIVHKDRSAHCEQCHTHIPAGDNQ